MSDQFRKNTQRLVPVISMFLCMSSILGGCEPLRKKLTRKKKEVKIVETIPVLEPIDYPAKVYSSQEVYKHHYSLWVVWHKELLNIVGDKNNARRKVYLLDQAVQNLEAVRNLIGEIQQQKLDGYLQELRKVRADLTAALPKRTLTTLKLNLTQLEGKIRREFKFEMMKDYLK